MRNFKDEKLFFVYSLSRSTVKGRTSNVRTSLSRAAIGEMDEPLPGGGDDANPATTPPAGAVEDFKNEVQRAMVRWKLSFRAQPVCPQTSDLCEVVLR